VATVAWFLRTAPLRIEWRLPTGDDGSLRRPTRGQLGTGFIGLRVPLDAWNRPALATRASPGSGR
jgi:hypothetical protein